MLTYVAIAAIILGLVAIMFWGEDGPLWKNMAHGIGVFSVLAAAGGLIIWVGTYGT